MKIRTLSIFLIFSFFNQNTLIAQGVTVSTAATSRTLSDFYGINGSNILESTTSLDNTNVNVGIKDSHASFLRYPGGTDANYWDWQDSLKAKPSGKLSDLRIKLSKDNMLIQQLENESDNYDIGKQLYYLDSINTTLQDSSYDFSTWNQIYNSLISLDSIYKFADSTLGNYLAQQGYYNNGINSNVIVNENEKILNAILVNHKLKINANFTSTEISNISSIATQCPREGGESVYRARTLMYKINRNIKYNDDVYCNTIAARKGKKIIENNNDYSMVPDRLNNTLKFTSKNSNDDLLVVKIFDLQGKLITSSTLNNNGYSKLFPFYFPKEAFYIVNLTDNRNHSYNFKLLW